MSNGRRCSNSQTGNNSQNGCECNCRNNSHEYGAADFKSQQRCSGVCPTRSIEDAVWTNHCCCAVAQNQGNQVESTDDANCPGHRATCFSSGRNGVETHQNVRQDSCTKNQGQAYGNEVTLRRSRCTILQTWLHGLCCFIAALDDGL